MQKTSLYVCAILKLRCSEADNVKRKSKTYAMADDQEILQEGAGATLFPAKTGMFPE
jgi:hypothetical protein